MLRRITLILLIAALALSAAAVAAQDATPEATPESSTAEEVLAPYLGIAFDEAENGVTVTGLDPDGPAASTGVEVGDVVTAINGEAVTVDTAVTVLSQYQPDEEVTLTVERDGETQEIAVTLIARPSERPDRNIRPPMPRQTSRPLLGVRLQENEAGVEIAEVVADTAADEAGLKAGDVITAINGESVTTPQEVQDAVAAASIGDTITVTVTRDGESMEVEATLGEAPQDNVFPFRMPRGGRDFVLPVQPGLFSYDEALNVYVVGELPEDSPYHEAGLQTGDHITAINGESVNNLLFNLHGEETVTITVERGDQLFDLDVPGTIVLDLMMGMGGGMFNMMPDGTLFTPLNARLGLTFLMLDEDNAAELEVEQTEGAYVRAVEPDSPAAEAGIQEGDIITAVDGETLSANLTLRDAITDNNPGDAVTLTVLRDGETQEITATLGEPQMQFDFEHPVIPRETRPRT